jgi:hypothetical protein
MFKNLYLTISKIGFGILTLTGSFSYAQQWQDVGAATISAAGSSFNNLAIDAQGNYYVSYYDLSVSKGSVQKFNGTSWSHVGGVAGITTGFATFNSLSVAPSGNNIYYTNQGTGLEVRQFNGTSWTQLASPTTSTVNYQASAVSSANTLFTYSTHNSGTVQRYLNGAWEQVGNTGFSTGATFAEMVIGSNNKIYTCNVASGVRVYENTTTATSADNWTLVGGAIVDAASSSEQYTSDIAIDANNNLYVAYVSNTAGGQKLNVKKFNGTSWSQVGAANFSSGKVQHVAIAVTSAGEPYVVASRWENDDMLKNTAYKFDTATQAWVSFGGAFISDGQATYNDVAIDKINNYLVLSYSQAGVKVKRISIPAPTTVTPACNNSDPGNTPGDTGCVTFNYKGQPVIYTTVRGTDGKIWLQQNLGSSQVATSMTDADSYGDLFQWGRWDDGHQTRTSATGTAPAQNNPGGLTGINHYIVGASGSSWWGTNATSDQWSASGASAVTSAIGADPCKAIGPDWKMPSQADWTSLVNAESIGNPATAYSSKLKLPAGGYRGSSDGGFTFVGQRGYFWSSDVASTGGKYLYIGTTIANPSSGAPRGQGASLRCMKEVTALSTTDIRKVTLGVYPNPTKGILNIKTDSNVENVNVTSIVGQKINVQVKNSQINMSGLPNGVYIVELMLKDGQKVSKKIIKN